MLALVAAVLITGGAAHAATPRVLVVQFENDVNPVTQDYLTDQIDRANKGHYDAVVIVIDTPGGLSESMRKIVKDELASKVPVIVYVSPDGVASRLGRRLDRPGGRHPRDGAADEHRLVDADLARRRRTSRATCAARS